MRGFMFIFCISLIHTTFVMWEMSMDIDVGIITSIRNSIYTYAGYYLSPFPLF